MKYLTMLVVGLMVSPLGALAQAVDRNTPSAVVPKEPPPNPARSRIIAPEYTPRDRSGPLEGDFVPGQTLKINGIVIVKTEAEVVPDGLPNANGIIIKDIPFLDRPDFRKLLSTRLGQRLTENAIRDIEDDIIIYSRAHGKLLVDVILLEQTIPANGSIQLWFLEGKVGKVTIDNPGCKWFKDSLFSGDLHLRPGQPLDSRQLKKDLDWLNNNPFRQVDAAFKSGGQLGVTDLEIRVEDRIPFRPYIGYENSGTTNTGPNRVLTGFNWGNAFGLDHQLNYQYATDVQNKYVWAHSASYIAPLPWRHTLMMYGSYVDARVNSGDANQVPQGTSWQVSLRYSVPLPDIQKYKHELAAGFDFKRGNNDIITGGSTTLQTDVDIDQFVLGYNGLLADRYGKTSVGVEGYYSPGDLSKFNNDADFDQLRPGTQAQYAYVRGNAERTTRLPYNFSWILRGSAQWASQRLQPSEELALGGYNTIRGYNERVFAGDNGYVINNELRTPPFGLGLFGLEDQLQFLGFFDFGRARVKDFQDSDLVPEETLYAVGLGLRYNVARNFAFRFDYGVPLTEKQVNGNNFNVHIGALLSY